LENQFSIQLFGETYLFQTTSELGKAEKVADILTKEVEKIESQKKGIINEKERLTILIIAAMNIVKTNIELIEKNDDDLKKLTLKADNIIRLLSLEFQNQDEAFNKA
jgi:hypothetical protein